MSLLVTGSLGIDSVSTPAGHADHVIGGSAIYFAWAAAAFSKVRLVAVVGLAACGQIPHGPAAPAPGSNAGVSSHSPMPSASPSPDLRLTPNIPDGADDIAVDKIIKVTASHGILSSVKVAGTYTDHGDSKKVTISGHLNKSKTGWVASDRLEPRGSYRITMTGSGGADAPVTTTTHFTSQNLDLATDEIYPSFAATMAGTVGVGNPVVLRFDTPVEDKKTFEKHLHITSSPHQEGSWHWYNAQEVHWRPKTYWEPGTKVTATADLNSIPAGHGKYGQTNASTHFTVGDAVITKVNLKTDIATVTVNGKRERTIKVSGGKPGDDTRSGTSLITQKATNYRMTSEMIGLPEDGPQSYDLRVKYALRITNSGEFLHSAPWNTNYFGKQNASHGCVGMSNDNAGWLYDKALPGSPVTITGTNRKLDDLNGLTDWNTDYHTYAKGSAN